MKVNLPIDVPEGNYCFDRKKEKCCEHFVVGFGHNECNLGFIVGGIVGVKWNSARALKDPKCKALEEVKT